MVKAGTADSGAGRLAWVDIMKGIAILWIVLFHFFQTYSRGRFPYFLKADYFSSFMGPCLQESGAPESVAPQSILQVLGCAGEAGLLAVVQLSFHAVGVFLVLSGFGLTYSLARTGGPTGGWGAWYSSRLVRLFPMYWLAHLIYLVSPFVARPEPIDYRFVLSFFGDRVYPIDTIFYYMNPAWWFFGLLLQLYLVFPLLFRLLQRMGPVRFLILCAVVTLAARYALLNILRTHGHYIQGGVFLSRLWEFAIGMVLGMLYRRDPGAVERRLFSAGALLAGIVIYTLALYTYRNNIVYTFSDPLAGTGLFLILAQASLWISWLGNPGLGNTGLGNIGLGGVEAVLAYVGKYSYSLFLLHQPHVIYLGQRVHELSVPAFLVLCVVVLAVLATVSGWLEQILNRWTSRLLAYWPTSARAQPPAR